MNTTYKRSRSRNFLFAFALILAVSVLFLCSPEAHAAGNNGGLIGAHIEDGVLKGYYGDGGDIVIPNTVTAIDGEAFKGNDNVTSVTIPGSVQLIGYYAFDGCTELERVIFSDPVDGAEMTIRLDAFSNCPKLSDIEIPATATYVTGNIFKNCTSLKKIRVHEDNPYYFTDENGVLFGPLVDYGEPQYEDSNYALTAYPCGRTGGYTVPDTVNGKTINQVWASAFRTAKGLTSIDFADGITILGGNAFEETGLTEVTIPETVKSLGASLFENCPELEDATLPESITSVQMSCFQGCSSLSRLNLPDSITTFEMYAFKDCTSLTSLITPKKLTGITLASFEGCTNLQRVVISPAVINFPSDEYAGYYDPFEDAPRSLVVYVQKGSAAEKWAYNNISDWGYSYVVLDDVYDLSSVGKVPFYLMDMGNKIRLDGNFEIGTTLKVTSVSSGEEYDTFKAAADGSALKVYQVSLLPSGADVQGEMSLSVGIPSGFTKKALLYSYEDGSATQLDTSVNATTATAKISGLGCFALIDSSVEGGDDDGSVTSVELNRSSAEMEIGDQIQLSSSVKPTNATDKSITWSSSNSKVATVNNKGVVTAVSAGSAEIKATAHNGVYATCSITVKGEETPEPDDDMIQTDASLRANGSSSDEKKSAFSLSLTNASRISTVQVTFQTSTDNVTFTGQNGFTTIGGIQGEWKDQTYTGTAVLAYLNGSKELFSNTGSQVIAQIEAGAEKATLKITEIKVAGWDKDETVRYGTVNGIDPDEATFTGTLSYDINGDSKVDLLDLAEAQKYYRAASGSAEWQNASRCDFVADGVISIDDFIEIWMNFTK